MMSMACHCDIKMDTLIICSFENNNVYLHRFLANHNKDLKFRM